jgi:hypothetical protein
MRYGHESSEAGLELYCDSAKQQSQRRQLTNSLQQIVSCKLDFTGCKAVFFFGKDAIADAGLPPRCDVAPRRAKFRKNREI